LLIANKVYAVSPYLVNHPGGPDLVAPWCGKEAGVAFATKAGRGSHSDFANGLLKDYYIGPLRR
jgi:cytochrome b involved in lipid metabolism